jgi:hypothetical protein
MKKLFFALMVVTMALPSFSFATAPVEDTSCGSNHTVPVVSATYDVEVGVRGILLTWQMINDSDFAGYKIVISKNDSTPNYPSNGYLHSIPTNYTTGYLINNNQAYNNGDFGSYLTVGQNYYFSVTAMYTCNGTTSYVPGNVLLLTYRGGLRDTVDTSQNTCDLNNDNSRDLADIGLFASCKDTFDANNDGRHDLEDVGEYASNYQNQSWCSQYMSECMSTGAVDSTDYLDIVAASYSNTTSSTTVRVYWKASMGSNGQYRYAKNQSELSNLPWRTDGVSNDPNVTGNMFASQVDLTGLEPNTTYYIQLRKYVGSGSDITYGAIKDLTFNTAAIDPSRYLDIVKATAVNISTTVTRVNWQTIVGSSGQYRYSKNQSELANLPWREDGVSNNPEVTENFGASQVDLTGLEAGATYYIQVRKNLGTTYGEPKTLTFIPGSYIPGNMGTYFADLNIDNTRVDQLALRSARVYWHAVNMSGNGYYRYATSTTALAGLPWSNSGVSDDATVTGNMNASMVTLNNLQPFTKYYIELKKTAGIPGQPSYTYGNPKTIDFTTLGGGVVVPDPATKSKVCHVVGNGKTETLEVRWDAMPAHMAHGDIVGACKNTSDDRVRPNLPISAKLIERVRGRILLQVESHGEAWYVNPKDDKRFYLKDGVTAYTLMREAGLGITNADLAKIPVGFEDRFIDNDNDSDGLGNKLEQGLGTDINKADTDGDGVNDKAEILAGTNPLGAGALYADNALANKLKGKIVLQVQSRGEAWYIDPSDGKRYYMRDGEAAYQIMRFRSLGITDTDLAKIAE